MFYIGFFRVGVTNVLMWSIVILLLIQVNAMRSHPCLFAREHCNVLLTLAWYFFVWGLFYDLRLWLSPEAPHYDMVKTAIGVISLFPFFVNKLVLLWKIYHPKEIF
jgi:hypothetical protein